MKQLSKLVPALAIAATIGLGACATTTKPGDVASDIPPRLVSNGTGVSTVGGLSWDRPDAFGPVPANQVARGQAACNGLGNGWKPTGYHPQAQGADGRPTPGGGFYCEKAM